jgi:hypothetical protein
MEGTFDLNDHNEENAAYDFYWKVFSFNFR